MPVISGWSPGTPSQKFEWTIPLPADLCYNGVPIRSCCVFIMTERNEVRMASLYKHRSVRYPDYNRQRIQPQDATAVQAWHFLAAFFTPCAHPVRLCDRGRGAFFYLSGMARAMKLKYVCPSCSPLGLRGIMPQMQVCAGAANCTGLDAALPSHGEGAEYQWQRQIAEGHPAPECRASYRISQRYFCRRPHHRRGLRGGVLTRQGTTLFLTS